MRCFHVANPTPADTVEVPLDYLVELLTERNFDTYETDSDGDIHKRL